MVRLAKTDTAPAHRPSVDKENTPVRRRWWRLPLLALTTLLLVGTGWFSYKVYAASNRIFTDNNTGGSPLLQGKKVSNEDMARVNVLLLGVGGEGHDGADLADTIQLVSIDPKHKQVSMVSLPRDLYVTVPNSYQKTKLNEVNSIGDDQNGDGGGGSLMKLAVKQITGQDVHYYIRVDFEGFQQIIDSVGGVQIDVKERLYDPYYPRGYGYQVLNVSPGVQQMNGELALKYARSRETTTDFDRSRRQQEVLVAARDKAMSLQILANPAKISSFIDILGNHVKTDMTLGEMQRLGKIVRDIPSGSVASKVVDNGDSGLLYDATGPGGAYILLPRGGNYTQIQAFVDDFFNGAQVRSEAATVELQNASGRDGLAGVEAAALQNSGITVSATATAPELAKTTVIYSYVGSDKSATASYLEKRYGVKVVSQPAAQGAPNFRVVIGSDYISSQSNSSYYTTTSSRTR